jgi:hypothetical protein
MHVGVKAAGYVYAQLSLSIDDVYFHNQYVVSL